MLKVHRVLMGMLSRLNIGCGILSDPRVSYMILQLLIPGLCLVSSSVFSSSYLTICQHFHVNITALSIKNSVAAAILGGVDNIWIKPGSKVLYLGAAAGTSVSHVSDIVGPKGNVYAVEFSHRPGRDLLNVAKSRTNVIPIIEDARHPLKYRMLVGMVDCVFADIAQPDQARIVALNSHYFLKQGGHSVIAIKASCIDSTAAPEAVFRREVSKLQSENFKPLEQLTLEPYERDHCVLISEYRPKKKKKSDE